VGDTWAHQDGSARVITQVAADFLRELSRPKTKKKRRRFSHKGAETRRRREDDPRSKEKSLSADYTDRRRFFERVALLRSDEPRRVNRTC